MNKSIKFEDLLNQLSEVVEKLESGNLSLDESINEYKLGISLANECKKLLEDAKKEVSESLKEE